jgi:hypothetical protein
MAAIPRASETFEKEQPQSLGARAPSPAILTNSFYESAVFFRASRSLRARAPALPVTFNLH